MTDKRDILAEMRQSVQTTSNRSDLYELLNSDERVIADEADKLFNSCSKLVKDSKASYRSNLKKALIQMRNGVKLTNNQKSAFKLYLELSDNMDK